MAFTDTFIRRPVFASVLSLVVVLLGILSFDRLTLREYPKIDEPVVSVNTTYTGASAEVIESQVTKPLEDALAGIEGVDTMSSTSRAERSAITVRFHPEVDIDAAAADVRDKVSRARRRLPDDIDEPIIAKAEADAQAVMYLAVSSDRLDQIAVSEYVHRHIKPRLGTLPGASEIRIYGERRQAMRIWLDSDRLAAHGVTVEDVETAVRRQNLKLPAGRIESQWREFTLLAETGLETPDAFGRIVVRKAGNHLVRLSDVAQVALGAESERTITRFNGKAAVGIGIVKQSVANPLDLSRAARTELALINETLPEGMAIRLGYDSSVFIEESIAAVYRTLVEAVLLVMLVTFVFLRNLRATLVPMVAIPVSLIGALTLMHAFGFSLNTLTLLALVLAVGLVVDDAIVVLENIHRHLEAGQSRLQAALSGAREIALAVVAMTLTLAAVYAPLAVMTGRTGRLFAEFALALAGAVLVSGFVALTLSPMMCSRLLRHEPGEHGRLYLAFERFFHRLDNAYRRGLDAALATRGQVLLLGLVVALVSGGLLKGLKSELAPLEDRGVIYGMLSAPEGAGIHVMDGYLRRLEGAYAKVADRQMYFTVTGFPTVSDGFSVLRLKPWDERSVSQQDVARQLIPDFLALPGVRGFPISPASLGQGRSKPVQMVVLSQAPYEELQQMAEAIMAEARKHPGLTNLDVDLRLNKPELKVHVARDKMADLGIGVDNVSRTLETALGGRNATRFEEDGEQYEVIIQLAAVARQTPDDIGRIHVRAADGRMVPLTSVVTVHEGSTPKALYHFNRLRSVTISANLAPGYALGEAVATLEDIARRTLPVTARTDLSGESREFRDSAGSATLTFLLAVLFIYLVLAAQFESVVDPFIILLTVPLAITGALGLLWAAGGTLNVYSQIGLVTLVGIITKHGILIVEFANQLQVAGRSRLEAVREAARLRLRPILMTTAATVLGAAPLALALGAGAESRHQIGWVIVGGMLFGTLLTLFVVPVAYSLLARDHQTSGV